MGEIALAVLKAKPVKMGQIVNRGLNINLHIAKAVLNISHRMGRINDGLPE